MTRILFTMVRWRKVKDEFRDDTFIFFPDCAVSPAYVSITTRVIVGQSSLHRLAVLRIGVLLPGIFLMVNVGLGKICGFRLESPSCVVSAGRDMLVAVTTDGWTTQSPKMPGNRLQLGAVNPR